jgi:hypothetical protein
MPSTDEYKGHSEAIRDGRIRLSLIDIIYGLVIGYGFNFFVGSHENNISIILFLCVVIAIACDWVFVHQDYWSDTADYGFWPFIIDLGILLCFTFTIRFAIEEPHNEALFTMGCVFILYGVWDVFFRETIKRRGRSWILDCSWDLTAAVAFFLLYRYSETLGNTIAGFSGLNAFLTQHAPKFLYENIQAWVPAAILLYLIMGPHIISDRIKRSLRGA